MRDVAIVRSGAHLSGTTIVGGDAVVGFTCGAGSDASSTRHAADRVVTARVDVKPVAAPFAPADLPLTDAPQPSPRSDLAPTETPTRRRRRR